MADANSRDALTKSKHRLPEGWSWAWLDDVMEIRGGAQPPASTFISAPKPGYIRFVQIRDFDTDAHHTYIENSSKWRRCEASDVLIARYGASLGRILRGLAGAYNVALVKAVPIGGIRKEFLYYLLRSPYFQGPLAALGARSAQEGFNRGDLGTISVPLPPIAEQRAIARVLGSLDDKIELNRRMNETLEAMARVLFKCWFVDFEPVRSKMRGEQPAGMDAATAALFPSRLVTTEHGAVPEGWSYARLASTCRLVMGQSPPGDTYNDQQDGVPFFQGATDFAFRFPNRRIYCTAPTRFAEPGDTLVSVRAPVGRKNMARERCAIGRGVAAVRHHTSASFGFYLVDGLAPEFEKYNAEGTVFGSINKDSFEALWHVEPPTPVVEAFDHMASTLDARILVNATQIEVMASLRDALLPRLLSGELRLPDAERLSEGAA